VHGGRPGQRRAQLREDRCIGGDLQESACVNIVTRSGRSELDSKIEITVRGPVVQEDCSAWAENGVAKERR